MPLCGLTKNSKGLLTLTYSAFSFLCAISRLKLIYFPNSSQYVDAKKFNDSILNLNQRNCFEGHSIRRIAGTCSELIGHSKYPKQCTVALLISSDAAKLLQSLLLLLLLHQSLSVLLRHAVTQWLRNYATNRKVAGSIPDEVNFPIYLIFPAALGLGVYSASNRNDYQKHKNNNVSWE
jgi:hypothetical protein